MLEYNSIILIYTARPAPNEKLKLFVSTNVIEIFYNNNVDNTTAHENTFTTLIETVLHVGNHLYFDF